MRILSMILLALSLAVATPAAAVEPVPAPAAAALVATPVVKPVPTITAAPAPVAPPAVAAEAPVLAPEKAAAPAPPVVEPAVPKTDAEAGVMLGRLLAAAQNGHWTLLSGLAILLMVFFFNKFGLAAKIGNKYVPWFTLALAAAISIAIGLANGVGVLDAIKLGLLEGGVAIALWELVFKNFSSTKADGTPRERKLEFPEPADEPEKKADLA